MTLSRTKEVLENIKAHYQSFSITENVVKKWYKVLIDYEFTDVIESLVDHLESDEYKEVPQVYRLVKYLKTEEEKQNQKESNMKYKICCNLCEKWMSMNEHEEHYGRCLDIEYLIGASKKVGKPMTRRELSKLSQNQIQALYDKYPARINKNMGVVKI